MTFSLVTPWILLLLPLPLLVRLLTSAVHDEGDYLVVPFFFRLRGETPRPVKQRGWLFTLWVIWSLAVVALAGPQRDEPPVSKEVSTQDTLLLVDLSRSMETQDFTNVSGQRVSRLDAVKEVLADFLMKRKNDRVGLIFFGSSAFIQAPFTDDLELCRELLEEAQVGMAGPQTAFGDAIGLAIHLFEDDPATSNNAVRERTAIVLTDGNDTASKIPPTKAAELARGITIHTISIGDPAAVGEDALDEATLQQVAEKTGGIYAHASDRGELDNIYQRLDELEKHDAQVISQTPRRPLHALFLAAALIVSVLGVLLSLWFSRERRGGWKRS